MFGPFCAGGLFGTGGLFSAGLRPRRLPVPRSARVSDPAVYRPTVSNQTLKTQPRPRGDLPARSVRGRETAAVKVLYVAI